MKKKNKKNILVLGLIEALFIFIIATLSIILYDMYINIDVKTNEEYSATKVSKEEIIKDNVINKDVSTILEDVSNSVVRNI